MKVRAHNKSAMVHATLLFHRSISHPWPVFLCQAPTFTRQYNWHPDEVFPIMSSPAVYANMSMHPTSSYGSPHGYSAEAGKSAINRICTRVIIWFYPVFKIKQVPFHYGFLQSSGILNHCCSGLLHLDVSNINPPVWSFSVIIKFVNLDLLLYSNFIS